MRQVRPGSGKFEGVRTGPRHSPKEATQHFRSPPPSAMPCTWLALQPELPGLWGLGLATPSSVVLRVEDVVLAVVRGYEIPIAGCRTVDRLAADARDVAGVARNLLRAMVPNAPSKPHALVHDRGVLGAVARVVVVDEPAALHVVLHGDGAVGAGEGVALGDGAPGHLAGVHDAPAADVLRVLPRDVPAVARDGGDPMVAYHRSLALPERMLVGQCACVQAPRGGPAAAQRLGVVGAGPPGGLMVSEALKTRG
mmetsp:Transcript_15372/g.31227  ORF Transcript_15372/g.31227 Transcript_15372/m.31227 type:complete len:253 (-) Transcript_15372:350-1108(-)